MLTHTVVAPPVVTTYTANFSTAYSLTTSVSKEGAGTVNPLGLQWFAKDEEVSLVATPETGYHFKHWTNPADNTVISKNNPLTIKMKEPKKIKANIVRILILWLL